MNSRPPVADAKRLRRSSVIALRPTSRGQIIGEDPLIRGLLETIDRVAGSMCTVLVTGESGTGKELVVAALHDANERRHGPLVTINCGAIPADLVESELFGHVRGAFTGAQATRRGHVATAEGGTLFLDEVGELPKSAQVKLLRLLQQREYTPVGDSHAVKCDVRIVAATNRDLRAEVRAGRFREDLFYRLNVVVLRVPSLHERPGDIRLLAKHFYRSFVNASGRTDLRGLSSDALEVIEAHSWPGNVRALENAIERAVLLAQGPMVESEDILGPGRGARHAPANASSSPAPAGRPSPHRGSNVTALRPAPAGARFVVVSAPEKAEPHAERPAVATDQPPASNPAFPRGLPDVGVELFAAVESYQNNLIRQALARTAGNKNRAAQLLGVNRTTLVEMIRRRGL